MLLCTWRLQNLKVKRSMSKCSRSQRVGSHWTTPTEQMRPHRVNCEDLHGHGVVLPMRSGYCVCSGLMNTVSDFASGGPSCTDFVLQPAIQQTSFVSKRICRCTATGRLSSGSTAYTHARTHTTHSLTPDTQTHAHLTSD